MPMVNVRSRLVNPGRRKRVRKVSNPRKKLTLKQKLFFGTPAQRAAARKQLKNPSKRRAKATTKPAKRVKRKRRSNPSGFKPIEWARKATRKRLRYRGKLEKGVYRYVLNPKKKRKSKATRKRRRLANVGQIVTFGLAGNPGKKRTKKGVKKVDRKRRRKNSGSRRRYGHRRNAGLMKRMFGTRRRRNYGSRRRRSNPGRRRYARRNPGMLSGIGGQVGGIILGAAVTKFLVDRVVPMQYATGITGYLVNAGVAYVQGMLVSRFAGKPSLGSAMQIGGYTQLALRILNDFAPGLSSYSALGLRGVLAQSSFYTPQVARTNSMTQFITPNAVRAAIPPPSMKGVRGGRV